MVQTSQRRVTAAIAAAVGLALLAVTAGSAGAWGAPLAEAGSRSSAITLPKVAIVFTQLNAVNGANLRIGDPLGLVSRQLTAPIPGTLDNGAIKSPDGRRVLFQRESDDGVFMAMVDLAEPGVVTIIDSGCRTTPDCVAEVGPTWSFDGTRVLFTRVMGPFNDNDDAISAVLYSVKLDGSDLRRISAPGTDPTYEEVGAHFSPDGKTMVYIRDTDADGVLRFAIFKSRPDGTHVQQMTPWELNGDRPSVSPARSGPTAGLVAFETYGGGNPGRGDVALIPLDCASVGACMASIRYVTHDHPGPKSAFAASWSPDGRFLSYVEESKPGWADVWTSVWDGSWPHQMTRGVISFSPSWGQ